MGVVVGGFVLALVALAFWTTFAGARRWFRWWPWYHKRPIPRELRAAVYRRWGRRCGNPFCRSRRDLSIDHVYPEVRGGRQVLANLRVLCRRCNSMKGAKVKPWWMPWGVFWLQLEAGRR